MTGHSYLDPDLCLHPMPSVTDRLKSIPVQIARRSRSFPLRSNLGLQLLALYMMFIGPVLLGALVFDYFTSNKLERDVKAADLALAHAIAQETDATLTNAARTVVNLATRQAVLNADVAGMREIFKDIVLGRSDINLIYRLDDNGIMRYHYPEGPPSTVGVDFSFRRYFAAAQNSTGPLFSDGRISPTTNKPVATAVMPLWDDAHHFRGVVATNLALDKLSDTLNIIRGEPSQGLVISIVDAKGQVIAYPDLLDTDLAGNTMLTVRQGDDQGLPDTMLPEWSSWHDDVVPRVLAGETGSLIVQAPDTSEWLRSYVPIPVARWGVIVQRPTRLAFATIRQFHHLLLIAIVVYLIGGILFWLALTRQVITPLEQLSEFSKKVGQRQERQHWRKIPLKPWSERPDQVGHLARSLATMAENIEAHVIELATLLETSRAVVRSLDANTVINTILDEVQRLLDVERCAIVALDERLEVFRIRASRGLSDGYVAHLRIEPSEPHSAAMRSLRSHRPVQIIDTELDECYTPFRERASAEGFRSLLAVPLLPPHAPPAVLILYHNEPYQYRETQLELISTFANQAAMAMEHAALYAQTDAQLQEQTRRLEAIVESLDSGLILESLEGNILYCNQHAVQLAGVRRSQACMKTSSELINDLLATATDPIAAHQAIQQALADPTMPAVDITRQNSDGQVQFLRIQVFQVTDARGQAIGRGQYWQDITRDKKIDRMKTTLLSTVSHELRTPLAAIKGYTTTLLAKDVEWDRETQLEFLQTISEETDRLTALVSNLLDLSRLEGGALQIQRELYPIDALLRETARREQLRLGNRLKLDIPSHLPALWIDRTRLETVIRNLLDNAAKYAPPDSHIELTAERHQGRVLIKVRDYGPGIPEEQRTKIFDRFYRGEIDSEHNIGGSGLGLAICKAFVKAHEGEIWVENGRPGAIFAFSLPIPTTVNLMESPHASTHFGR